MQAGLIGKPGHAHHYRSFGAELRIHLVVLRVIIVREKGLSVVAAGTLVGTGKIKPATAERSGECSPEGATREIARGDPPAADPEMVARLPSEVAHAINNALAVIVGNLELIASRPEDPERTLRLVERALETVQRATQQSQRLRVAAMRFEQAMTNRSGSCPAPRQSPDGKASLLVVDDDPDVLEVARANLSDLR